MISFFFISPVLPWDFQCPLLLSTPVVLLCPVPVFVVELRHIGWYVFIFPVFIPSTLIPIFVQFFLSSTTNSVTIFSLVLTIVSHTLLIILSMSSPFEPDFFRHFSYFWYNSFFDLHSHLLPPLFGPSVSLTICVSSSFSCSVQRLPSVKVSVAYRIAFLTVDLKWLILWMIEGRFLLSLSLPLFLYVILCSSVNTLLLT